MSGKKKITDKTVVSSIADSDMLIGNFGGKVGQITMQNFRTALNTDDRETLETLAFSLDINGPSSKKSEYVDVGGNPRMREMWESMSVDIIMNKDGYYTELNPNDCRFTADGQEVIDTATGKVTDRFAHCDFMVRRPQTYGRVVTRLVGSVTKTLLYLSPLPLPNGFVIPEIVVGKFKTYVLNNAMRSLPGYIPTANKTINAFWTCAQNRSKNHGIANLDFRNFLLWHMMSKYGYRDSQNCKGSDGTPIWGVGLDGTESTGSDKFECQKSIVTGHTLSLGNNDGKTAVTDADGTIVHGVNVAGFENPWGQYWEMVQGLCSVGTDVYCWRHNWLPSGTPTADTFVNVDHVLLTRPTSPVWGMNIITSKEGQGVYMIPKQSISGISYGDNYWYTPSGQLCVFGGSSSYGSKCGLASAYSSTAWSYAYPAVSARLAYYGSTQRVTSTQLAGLT